MPKIYSPAEDSFFLSDVLKKEVRTKGIKVLDMGSGSGTQAETLINLGIKPKDITIADINPEAISHLKKKFPASKVIRSNLFAEIKKNEKFDLIVFNPPYLPKNKYDKEKDTSGGEKGDEIILRFLKELKDRLNESGRCLLLLSSLTPTARIYKEFKRYGVEIIADKKLFFEKIFVCEICLKK
jgi:release factor glutamine methyltransferase